MKPIPGGTVMLVEDSLIIALDAEDMLLRLGAARVTAVASVAQGLEALAAETPALAILDINLGSETSLPVAERLVAANVPFLFATGYGDQARLPEALGDVPVLQKPYTIESVARAVAALLAR